MTCRPPGSSLTLSKPHDCNIVGRAASSGRHRTGIERAKTMRRACQVCIPHREGHSCGHPEQMPRPGRLTARPKQGARLGELNAGPRSSQFLCEHLRATKPWHGQYRRLLAAIRLVMDDLLLGAGWTEGCRFLGRGIGRGCGRGPVPVLRRRGSQGICGGGVGRSALVCSNVSGTGLSGFHVWALLDPFCLSEVCH